MNRSRPSRILGHDWRSLSSSVLVITGAFVFIEGLIAVTKASYFTSAIGSGSNTFPVWTLNTWGWIFIVAGAVSALVGVALASTGAQWARWLGILVSGVTLIGQLMFARAQSLWTLTVVGLYALAIYGLATYGHNAEAVSEMAATTSDRERDMRVVEEEQPRRVA